MYSLNGAGADWPTNIPVGTTINFFTYLASATVSDLGESRYAHFVGQCKPGDFVTYDNFSNMTVTTNLTTDNNKGYIIGRVMAKINEPRGLLDRVKTAYEGVGFDKTAQMPGSATSGFSDLLTLTGEAVSDEIVVVNIKIQ